MSAFLVSQILVGFVFLLDLASFQFKKREITLSVITVGASINAVHFYLLGQDTAALVMAVGALRLAVSIFSSDKRLMYVFLVLILSLGLWTYDGLEDVFSIFAITMATIAAFQIDGKRLRQFWGVASLSIITHNIMIFSPAGIALEVFFLGSNLVSYWRFYLRKQSASIVNEHE